MQTPTELRQLMYFVKVAETLNFSEAAKALCVTQSTLSQQIKQLEWTLDTQLFCRSRHKVSLTEAGTELLPYAKNTIYSAEMCAARINDLNQLHSGTLNIGVTYSFSPILTETIITFMRTYPGIKLNIFYKPMSELMEYLKQRQVDFALAFRPTVPIEGVESHILFQNHLSVIVNSCHPIANLKSITLSELEKYDLALPSKGLQARNFFDHITTMSGNKFRIKIELNEVNILLKLVRSTNLVSVLAEATIHDESNVKAIPLQINDNEMTGCVHVLKDSYKKQSMQKFIKMLNESMAVKARQNAWL